MQFWYTLVDLLPFEWAEPGSMLFMKNALLAVLVISPLFGLLSTMVVHSRMSFFSDALGHSAFTGMAIGALCGFHEPSLAAVFFAISSGKTESAKDIWGSDDPHLQSRDSAWDTEASGFTGEVQITSEEFQKKIRAKYASASFPVGKTWFSDWKRSEAGSVLSVKVGGVTVKGSELRALLGLRSSNFSVSFAGGIYTFTTKGYGHGVGMSQYGARALALSGKNYAEILGAYYSDFKLEKIKG